MSHQLCARGWYEEKRKVAEAEGKGLGSLPKGSSKPGQAGDQAIRARMRVRVRENTKVCYYSA